MYYFRYKTDRFNIDIESSEKVTILYGWSGAGKTELVELINDLRKLNRSIECSIPVEVLSSVYEAKDYNGNKLFVVDEDTLKFHFNYIKESTAYWLIVSRKIYSNLKLSYRSYWNVNRYDSITKSSKYSDYGIFGGIFDLSKTEIILTEDSGYGLLFMKSIATSSSMFGKGNIPKYLGDYAKQYDYIVLLLDAGGIGHSIKKIAKQVNSLRKNGKHIYVPEIECFEHILLCSGFLQFDVDMRKYYTTRYQNTEEMCEELLLDKTAHTPIKCNHNTGYMSDCWLKDCTGECTKDCFYYVVGSKIVNVIKDGPVKELLRIIEKEDNFGKTPIRGLSGRV